MEKTRVDSSNLYAIGYDEEIKVLEVEFNSGQVYEYYNVPKVIYSALMSAASHGQYFSQNIRTSYKYKRIV